MITTSGREARACSRSPKTGNSGASLNRSMVLRCSRMSRTPNCLRFIRCLTPIEPRPDIRTRYIVIVEVYMQGAPEPIRAGGCDRFETSVVGAIHQDNTDFHRS